MAWHGRVLLVLFLVSAKYQQLRYQQNSNAALTDTYVKNAKHTGKPAGNKHSDGGGLHLHITASGKCCRLAYKFSSEQKTLALGVYPDVSLLQARKRCDDARKLLADGTDPGQAKKDAK